MSSRKLIRVITSKISYIRAIEEILNDHTKFPNLEIPAGKEINYITNFEKKITSDLKLLKDEEIIDKATYKNIKPVGSKPGVLYGLGKVHKEYPLGPALANIFMCNFENKWLRDCPHSLKPAFYRRYVDDIFALLSSLDQAEKFKKYLSSKHPNINFSLEKENEGRLSFLDVNIFREKGKFVTNVFRKKTFSGVYTNFDSFIPETYKTGLIKSLLFRCFNLCSDFVKFHHEIDILKGILYKNSYPRGFVDKCIKEFLDRVLTRKVVVSTVPKKDLMIVLPYLGKLSLQIRTRINRVIRNKLLHCNLRIVFQTKCKLINFFTFKDKIPVFLRSGIVYKFKCGGCNATYYGKTKRHFKIRMCERLGVSALTGKRVKGDNGSAIKEHHLFCNYSSSFDDFSILASNNNDFKVTLMESLLINRDHPPLNKNRHSLPLELFDD